MTTGEVLSKITILPRLTPQQQMALAFRDFPLPEAKVVPGGVVVWSVRADGQWAEAFGRDINVAVQNLAREIARA